MSLPGWSEFDGEEVGEFDELWGQAALTADDEGGGDVPGVSLVAQPFGGGLFDAHQDVGGRRVVALFGVGCGEVEQVAVAVVGG